MNGNVRTPTDRLAQHLTTMDLVGAAREAKTGTPHGGNHLQEVSEAAAGLRRRIHELESFLTNPKRTPTEIEASLNELGKASKLLDAAEQAMQGQLPRHD